VKALITGGGGFLGSHIARQLLARGDEVWVLGRSRYPEVEAAGATGVVWDLAQDRPGLPDLLKGMDVVFHTAAKAGIWGDKETYWSINVEGTRRILEAARQSGVPRFVHTSSPSCTFDGGSAENATEEDCPYPTSFEAHYPASKAAAERLVLAANGPNLATTSLRPHLIWGPGDPHLLPRLLKRNGQRRLKMIGEGTNRVGITYVDNAAAAHVQAADALRPGSANAGRAYFVTDPEPVLIWEWVNGFFVRLGQPPVQGRISLSTARAVGQVLEWGWRLFRLGGEPPMTRFVASQLATSHWYDLSAARADFGLTALVDPEEAMDRAVAWFETQEVP
jgi:nucleoside-diphosphate-sugar epimerase